MHRVDWRGIGGEDLRGDWRVVDWRGDWRQIGWGVWGPRAGLEMFNMLAVLKQESGCRMGVTEQESRSKIF